MNVTCLNCGEPNETSLICNSCESSFGEEECLCDESENGICIDCGEQVDIFWIFWEKIK